MKMAKNRQCGPDETECPAGCCPEANWFCCPDNMYCAATAADCPFVAKKAQLMKMAKNRQCGPDETSCPAGCCPEANWFCCPDNMYCAATASNVAQEVAIIVQTIRKEMKSELVPLAEEKATYGKIVKASIRELWALEYEIEEIQTEFAKGIGSIDIEHLTDDFVEDVMLQSKPLQGILMAIRLRQKEAMEGVKAKYGEAIGALEPLKLPRPPKAAPAPAAPVAPKAEAPAAAPVVE